MKEGILLINLGTPDAPTFWHVRRYLKEFLSDPMVVDLPRWKWWPILNLIILNIRPFKSAKNYQKIWTPEGSPLLVDSQKILEKLQQSLPNVPIALGMRYGNPSLEEAMQQLKAQGVTEIIALPLYPQYSRTTTGTTFAKIEELLTPHPTLSLKGREDFYYHNHPLYIKALKDSIEDFWQQHGKPQKLILSYHGLPERYVEQGDPYYQQCLETTTLLREALKVGEDFAIMTFQSRVGLEEWLKPYTMKTLQALPQQGIRHIQVICPGFACDCLETLEEIDMQNREAFLENGGTQFAYIPCLNAQDSQTELLKALINTKDSSSWSSTPTTATSSCPCP